MLDDTGARTMARAPPALDRVHGLIETARGRRRRGDDPSQMLHQPARRARNLRRQLTGLSIDEVTEIGDPGHRLIRTIRLPIVVLVFVFSYSRVVRPTFYDRMSLIRVDSRRRDRAPS